MVISNEIMPISITRKSRVHVLMQNKAKWFQIMRGSVFLWSSSDSHVLIAWFGPLETI